MDELLVAIQNAANTIAEPNWADIMSVCLSLLAVVAAGIIAWRQNSIANRQNKITLFEKRYEIYKMLSYCKSNAEDILMAGAYEDVLKYLFVTFAEDPEKYYKLSRAEVKFFIAVHCLKLQSAAFFFSKKIVPHIIRVSDKLSILSDTDAKVDGSEKFNEKKQNYYEAIKALEKNEVFESIIAEMKTI